MHPVIEKQTAASLHILGLILECGKTEISVIRCLAESFAHVVPSGAVLNAGLLSETLENLKGFMSEGCSACPGEDGEAPAPQAPAPSPSVEFIPATPAPAKAKAKAKATPAPAPAPASAPAPAAVTPAPAAETPIAETPDEHTLPEETGLSAEAAERLRALIRDTFTARSKKIAAEGDPNNAKKLKYTADFTAAVKSFGADTVTLTDNSKLQDLLDTVRAI